MIPAGKGISSRFPLTAHGIGNILLQSRAQRTQSDLKPGWGLRMAAATILHVGEDICHRIRVMEKCGLSVVRSECSVEGVRGSFASGDIFSAITFTDDGVPIATELVSVTRELTRAPLVLFENTWAEFDEQLFDLVIPVPTPPAVWSKTLAEVIRDSRRLYRQSRRLRFECSTVRSESRSLQESSRRNRVSPIDYEALFRGEAGQKPDGSDDEGGS